jgi:hypothetical protein
MARMRVVTAVAAKEKDQTPPKITRLSDVKWNIAVTDVNHVNTSFIGRIPA